MASELEDLMAQIIARPDDMAPRLAYADVCDAAKDPRGEFIRIQVRFSTEKMPIGDRVDIMNAFRAILRAHEASWTKVAMPLARKAELNRGFVELVEVDATTFIEQGAALFARMPLRHLDIVDLKGKAAEVFASPLLQNIETLSLVNNRLDDGDAEIIASSPHLTRLRWMDLDQNDIGIPGFRALAGALTIAKLDWIGLALNRAANPHDTYGHDLGVVVDEARSGTGEMLEEEFGPIRWLHWPHTEVWQYPPWRFYVPW